MSATNLTFGVEIEAFVPVALVQDGTISIGSHSCGNPVAGLPMNLAGKPWRAAYDSSIAAEAGYVAVEFVSPVLKGVAGLRNVVLVVEQLNAWGVKVNTSCGFHCHVGFDRSQIGMLEMLVKTVASFEPALYASTGTKRRERSCWCRSIKGVYRSLKWDDAKRTNNLGTLGYGTDRHSQRYHTLNITNLVGGSKPTVEFRTFEATLNVVTIITQIRVCLAIVEKSAEAKRAPAWDAKKPVATSPIARGGEGLTEVNRLLYALGWTKGREPRAFGDVAGDGIPTLAESKAELVRLAKGYDAAAF